MSKEIWDKLARPPKTALKTISGGRLKGFTDINPQWRYEIMTDVFGMIGFGWKFTIDRTWLEGASDNQLFAFAQVSVYVKQGNEWSAAIQGHGGSMLVEQEKSGLHSSDEGYKMAITDALGTALKMLGVASDIYAGRWDGSKYKDEPKNEPKATLPALTYEETVPYFKGWEDAKYNLAKDQPDGRADDGEVTEAWAKYPLNVRSAIKKYAAEIREQMNNEELDKLQLNNNKGNKNGI